MSCKDCEKEQNEGNLRTYYRIENANIEIAGCPKHMAMAINKMRQADGLSPFPIK